MSDQNQTNMYGQDEQAAADSGAYALKTPGAILRHYRQERGVSLEDLAAVLKVSASKLDALERDDYDMLPDMVFTRALSLSYCRLLGADPAPAMALFPSAGPRLINNCDGLNRPIKAVEQPATAARRADRSHTPRAAIVLGLIILLAAALVFFWSRIQQEIGMASASGEASQMVVSQQPGHPAQGHVLPAGGAGSAGSAASGTISIRQPLQSQHVAGTQAQQGATAAAPPAEQPPAAHAAGAGAAGVTGTASAAGHTDATHAVAGHTAGPAGADHTPGAPAAPAAGNGAAGTAAATGAAATGAGNGSTAAATLHIAAGNPVWVQVSEVHGNRQLYQGILPKGGDLSIAQPGPLRVDLGHSDGVQVTVRGKPFNIKPFLSARGVARFEVPAP